MNIAVFASHEGSDLQAIIDGCKEGRVNAKVCVVLSNNLDAKALERASKEKINSYYLDYKSLSQDELDIKILQILETHKTDIIFLAGYLKKLGKKVLHKYNQNIFNVHPALLPKYGGKGMYGMNVHRAVLEAEEKESGITIHRVNEEYDSGEIIAQVKVKVLPDDIPETLAARILEHEHTFIVEFLNNVVENR